MSKKGNWVMEDWLHWTEAWSMYVLRPDAQGRSLLHPTVEKMWNELRSGLLYFCRSYPTPGVAESASAACAHLKEYAKLVEEQFGTTMCKFNLHLLICRLVDQELARGKVAHSTEYWVENLIQWAKSTVRYRTTKYPELVLASDMLVDDAVARCIAAHPGLRGVVEGWAHTDGRSLNFTCMDDAAVDGTQLLGSGRVVSAADRVVVESALVEYIQQWHPAGWSENMVAAADMLWYSYAHIRAAEILHSLRYTRPRSKVSYNVLCQYYEGEEAEDVTRYIAQVQFFLKVSPGPAACGDQEQPAEPLRLAISHLYKLENVDWGVGVLYHSPTYPANPAYTNYAVGMTLSEEGYGEMQDKHAMACNALGAWFMPYSNMSAAGMDDAVA
jgi:hypothetical protein